MFSLADSLDTGKFNKRIGFVLRVNPISVSRCRSGLECIGECSLMPGCLSVNVVEDNECCECELLPATTRNVTYMEKAAANSSFVTRAMNATCEGILYPDGTCFTHMTDVRPWHEYCSVGRHDFPEVERSMGMCQESQPCVFYQYTVELGCVTCYRDNDNDTTFSILNDATS